jgi:hypothetical protein
MNLVTDPLVRFHLGAGSYSAKPLLLATGSRLHVKKISLR